MSKCQATTKDGKPCKAPAQTGKVYCFQHDPQKKQAAAEGRAKGGQTRADQLSGAIVPQLDTATAVSEYIPRLLRDIAIGLIDHKKGAVILKGCRLQLEVIQRAKVEVADKAFELQFPTKGIV